MLPHSSNNCTSEPSRDCEDDKHEKRDPEGEDEEGGDEAGNLRSILPKLDDHCCEEGKTATGEKGMVVEWHSSMRPGDMAPGLDRGFKTL